MEDLSEQDARLALRLAELAPFVMFVTAPDGTITSVTGPVERLFGQGRDQVVGTNVFDHVDVSWNADAIDSVAYAMEAKGLQRPMLFRLLRSDGSGMIAEITANAQLDDPDIAGLAVYARPWDERWGFDRLLDAMAENTPLGEIIDLVLAVMGTENLDAEGVLVYRDPSTGERRVQGHANLGELQRLAADVPGTPWATALRDEAPCAVPVAELPEPLAAEAAAHGHRWCWAWPIPALDRSEADGSAPTGSDMIGALVLWRRMDEPPDHTCRMTLGRLVRFIALVFRRETLTRALRHAALHDPLTGLSNRAAFFAELDAAIRASDSPAPDVGQDAPRPVVVVSIDLDGFKPVNDRLGHAAGDDVLVAVAERLRSHVRDPDLVARLGGDEFCILCRGLDDTATATRFAERIVAALSEPVITRAGVVRVGASVGLAVSEAGDVSGGMLLEAADHAMYRAKADGSGNWRLGSPGSPDETAINRDGPDQTGLN